MLKAMFRWLWATTLTTPDKLRPLEKVIHHGWLTVVIVGYTTVHIRLTDGASLPVCLHYALESIINRTLEGERKQILLGGVLSWGYSPLHNRLRVYMSAEALINLQTK